MGLFSMVKESVYSPIFYRGLREKKLSFSLKYFFSLIIAFSLALTVLFSFEIIPVVVNFVRGIGPTVISYYPDELSLTISNGKVSTNVAEPYLIKMPEELKGENNFANLLVIDTKNGFTPERFNGYDTLALLNQNSIAYTTKNGEIRFEPLSNLPNIVIDKGLVRSLVTRLEHMAKWATPLLVFAIILFMFLAFVFLFSLKLVWLFLGALFVMLLAWLKKTRVNYSQAYRIGIHAMTISLFFTVLTFLGVPRVTFLFTLVFLVFVWLNLSPKEEAPTV